MSLNSRNSTVKLIIVAFTIILISLLILEGLLRMTHKYTTFYEDFDGEYLSHYAATGTDWYRMHPPYKRDTSYTREYAYQFFTNSIGLRDDDHPVEKDSGEIRIMGVGDSFTECLGAPPDSSWVRLLTGLFQEDNPGTRFTPIVGGVSGSDPFFGYVQLRDKLLQFEPDLVIYAMNISDFDDVSIRGGMERFLPDTTITYRPAPWFENMYKYSHVVRFIVHDILNYNYFLVSPRKMRIRDNEAIDGIAGVLTKMDSLVRANGSGFLVVLQPLFYEVQVDRNDWRMDQVREELTKAGVKTCNLLPFFNEPEINMKSDVFRYYWPYDAHFNSRGYSLFAQGVYSSCKNDIPALKADTDTGINEK